jgi:hypothetical protein
LTDLSAQEINEKLSVLAGQITAMEILLAKCMSELISEKRPDAESLNAFFDEAKQGIEDICSKEHPIFIRKHLKGGALGTIGTMQKVISGR